jgi:APA family basic amino acid/polyamine antiporter
VGISKVVALGAVFSMAAVLLVFQIRASRGIFFAMARDGLLPQWAAKVDAKTRIPYRDHPGDGVFVAFWSLIGDAAETYDLTNIGTLFAFVLVCLGVIVLRHTIRTARARSACRSSTGWGCSAPRRASTS